MPLPSWIDFLDSENTVNYIEIQPKNGQNVAGVYNLEVSASYANLGGDIRYGV